MSIRRVVPIEDAEWCIGPPPSWVESRDPDWHFAASGEHPVAFLLVDEQHDVATQAISFRNVRRLLTHGAVQALGQVEVEFDPAAHRLVIHELAVWRLGENGAWAKRSVATRNDFMARQREAQLEQQMLTGRISLVALLEDVRVGDAIDLAWTLERTEPLPGLRFAMLFAFSWQAPVARAYLSLRQDPAEPVTWRMHLPDEIFAPEESITGDRVTWELQNPPEAKIEPNAPGSNWPYAVIDVSGWSSWGAVGEFFSKLWTDALEHDAESIQNEAARLRAEHGGSALMRETIRFVQEDIRYLGVDFGHGAGMLPNGAGIVLRRRFGDCKDKAVLLTALLRVLGFDACPLLVAANWTTAISRTQPSIAVFSHAIVRLTVNERHVFVDPTFIGQGGDLEHLTPPPYGCGLEVREGVTELVSMPNPQTAELHVTEIFQLDRKSQNGSLEQVLHARGAMADDVRAVLVRDGHIAFAKMRADALQSHFPALVPSEEPIAVSDDREGNLIEIRTRHNLPTWGPATEKPPLTFNYGAHGLFFAVEYIEGPSERQQPWVLRHPLTAHHRVVVRGKCVRKTPPENHQFTGPGFRYECKVRATRNEVSFDYHWETTQHEISPEDWPEYSRTREQAFEQAGATVVTNGRWTSLQKIAAGFAVMIAIAFLANIAENRQGSVAIGKPAYQESHQVGDSMKAARRAIERGDYESASSLLDSLVPYYSESYGFHLMRADAAIRAGEIDFARQAIASARRIEPWDSDVFMLEARLDEFVGDLSAARKSVERVLLNEPNHTPALWMLSRIDEQTGDEAGALRSLERLLSLHPAHPDALVNYAYLLWEGGEPSRLRKKAVD